MSNTMTIKDGVRVFTGAGKDPKKNLGFGLRYEFHQCYQNEGEWHHWLKSGKVPKNTSLCDMIKDIKKHKCRDKKFVLSENHNYFQAGFCCVVCDTIWRISSCDLYTCFVHFPEYKENFSSPEAREKFAESLGVSK
jgi:hypothetical protein